MKISSLTRSPVVFLSRTPSSAHLRPATTVRAAARRGRSHRRSPERPDRQLTAAAPRPAGCRRSRAGVLPEPGGDAAGALAGGLVDAVVEVRAAWSDRVGLAPRRVGQVQAVGSAVSPNRGWSSRLVGRAAGGAASPGRCAARSRGTPRPASSPALTMPLRRQGNSGEYARSTRSWAALTSPSRIRLSPFWSRKPRAVSANAGMSAKQRRAASPPSSSRVPVVVTVSSRIWRDLGEHVGVECRRPAAVSRRSSTNAGDLRVDPLEVGVDGLEVLAELLAAALEGGGERVQGHVEVRRLHGAQQRVEVGEDLLDLGARPRSW